MNCASQAENTENILEDSISWIDQIITISKISVCNVCKTMKVSLTAHDYTINYHPGP